jgi:hypothetical protein
MSYEEGDLIDSVQIAKRTGWSLYRVEDRRSKLNLAIVMPHVDLFTYYQAMVRSITSLNSSD